MLIKVGGQCNCKVSVDGRQCDKCKASYKNLLDSNPDGCEYCNCNLTGSVNTVCDEFSGQCNCRPNVEGNVSFIIYDLSYRATFT